MSAAKQPYALLDTVEMTTMSFATIEEMREARANLALRGHPCVSFRWDDGNYWIDGMTERQVGKVITALNHPEGLQRFPINPAQL